MVGRRTSVPIDELRAVLVHVRALDVGARRRAARTQVAAYAAFAVILAGSLRAAPPHAYLSSSPQPNEESRMRILQNLGVVSSIALTASAATAQNAVQWRVEDGGNGHWYSLAVSGLPFPAARAHAESVGGHLVTITSAAEQSFVANSIANQVSFLNAWMGLLQDNNAFEPAGGWRWVTGEALQGYSNWWSGVQQPDNNACGLGVPENFAMWAKQWGGTWADVTADQVVQAACTDVQTHAILEWSADCNSDGTVDYGQIRAGELADTNANNIPDCCETALGCDPCRADIDQSGAVNGVDLAAILNNWGTSGGKQPRSDVNSDGIVDGADLAEVLNSWGTCP